MKYCYLIFFFMMSAVVIAQPIAICVDQLYVSLPNGECNIIPQTDWVDEGSYDPRGLAVNLSIPSRPLGLGEHTLMMTVSNSNGSNSCWVTIIVEDKFPPELDCYPQDYYLVHPDQDLTIDVDDLYTLSDYCGVEDLSVSVPDIDGFGTGNFVVSFNHVSGSSFACVKPIRILDGEPQDYCDNDLNSGYEHIRRVGIAGRQFPTGNDGGYRWHYNHSPITLYHGSTYTVNYTPGFQGNSVYRLYWRVYLDKNGDGDFTDSGELLQQWNGTGVNAFTFTSPGTFWGMSRLRVVMSYGGYASSCSGRWGEVEDISVMLRPFFFIPWPWGQAVPEMTDDLASAEVPTTERANDPWKAGEILAPRSPIGFDAVPATQQVTSEEVRLFPNPVASGKPISINGAAGTQEVIIINAAGQRLATRQLTGDGGLQRIELPVLPAGIYLIQGVTADGESGWTRRVLVR